MRGGAAELPRFPQDPGHVLELAPPSCLAALPPHLWAGQSCAARGQLWALGTVAATGCKARTAAFSTSRHQENAPQLRIQSCASLPALSWLGQLQDTELAATGIQHLHLGVLAQLHGPDISSPAPAFCIVPAEILHLRVFSDAWRHFNHHKTTTWRWFPSPLSCPVHEGP